MRIEVLIFAYGAVCISMIVFNCVCIAVFKGNDRRLLKKSGGLDKKIAEQTRLISSGKPVSRQHVQLLNKRLSRVGNLMVFDESVSKLVEKDKALAELYLYEIRSVFAYLAAVYLKKEAVQTAYFSYILAKYQICRIPLSTLIDIVKEYLCKDSLYCRQNAMGALYRSGRAGSVVEGLLLLEQKGLPLHGKIVTDGLLSFAGSHDELLSLLWQAFEGLSVNTQAAVINYIRLKSGDYCEEMFQIMTDCQRDSELRFAAIRYFGKYRYMPAQGVLQAYANDLDILKWEFAALAAFSLANYPGEETVRILKKALTSSNWHVRSNAAQSLDALGLTYHELIDVINGNDRFAREAVMYRFERRQIEESGEKVKPDAEQKK